MSGRSPESAMPGSGGDGLHLGGTARVLFAVAVFVGHALLLLNPQAPARFGLVMMDRPFLDSHAILAAGDAVRAGLDPWKPNPLDTLGRPHSYSSWWLFTATLGLSRDDNAWIGPLWQITFLLTALLILRPSSSREMLLAAAVLFSPPVLLGVSRANNDLPVFALLALGLLALASGRRGVTELFGGSVVLAAGLKFYPIAAAAALIALRPRTRALAAFAVTVGLAGVALSMTEISRAMGIAPSPLGTLTFGHATAMRMAGWDGLGARAIATGLIAILAILLVARGSAPRISPDRVATLPALAFVAGSAVLVACFLAAGNYAYRLVYVALVVPHLASTSSGPTGRMTLGLMLALVWMDGVFLLLSEPVLEGLDPRGAATVMLCWALCSQTVTWLAVALLAAGLLDATRRFLHPQVEQR